MTCQGDADHEALEHLEAAMIDDPEGWPNAGELEDAWRHRDDEPLDDDRLDELAGLEGWAQADDAWQPDDERVAEHDAVDYDGAGTYADPDE